jgi:hypothetical protein
MLPAVEAICSPPTSVEWVILLHQNAPLPASSVTFGPCALMLARVGIAEYIAVRGIRLWAAAVARANERRLANHRLNELTHPLTQAGFDWIKPIIEKMDRRLGFRLQGPRTSCYCCSWRSLHRCANTGIVWVNHPEKGRLGSIATAADGEEAMTTDDLMQQIAETERLIAVYRNANEVIVGTQDEIYSRRGLINRTTLSAAEIGDQIVRILQRRVEAMRAELQKLGVEYQGESR